MTELQLTNPDAWLEVLGRSHVVLVHFPVGLIIIAAVVEIFGALFTRRRVVGADEKPAPRPSGAVITMLAFGAISAAVAAISGWTYAEWDLADDTSDILWWHRWVGVASAAVAAVALVGAVIARISTGGKSIGIFRLMLVLGAVLVGFAGHYGGTMVHGPGHLIAPLYPPSEPVTPTDPTTDPTPTDAVASAPPTTDPATDPSATNPASTDPPTSDLAAPRIVFASHVQPIFESNCFRCHGPRRQRGGLRLDMPDLLAERIAAGDVIVAGDPAASELVRRISLPADDFDHMPPGDESLPPEQVKTISDWIVQGASVAALGAVGDSNVPGPAGEGAAASANRADRDGDAADSDEAVSTDAGDSESAETDPPPAPAPEPDPLPTLTDDQKATRDAAIARINEREGAARVIAASTDAVEVDLSSLGDTFTADDLPLLSGLEPALVWLDCSSTPLTDEHLAALAPFTQLRRLNLADTAVTDAALPVIADLPRIEVLNLNGTAVTDEGILALRPLSYLRRIYLWRSQVSPTGAASLRATNPNIDTILE